MFDLIAYAKDHRYRLRNLADGHPCPPTKPPNRTCPGYRADSKDADMAIIGQYGYVNLDGDHLGVYILSHRPVTRTAFETLGGTINQDGEGEFAGSAPVTVIRPLMTLIRVYRIPNRNPTGKGSGLETVRRSRKGRNSGDLPPGGTMDRAETK